MNRGRRRTSVGILIVSVLALTVGCSKLRDYWGPKHPDPPPGLFPPQVGKMHLDPNVEMNPGCTRGEPLHCWGNYIDPGGDPATTLIYYWVDIYDSRDQANAAFEALPAQRISDDEDSFWVDRVNKEGVKVGKLLLKSSSRKERDSLGYCSLQYTKDRMVISILHGFKCQPAREFLKDLTAITD